MIKRIYINKEICIKYFIESLNGLFFSYKTISNKCITHYSEKNLKSFKYQFEKKAEQLKTQNYSSEELYSKKEYLKNLIKNRIDNVNIMIESVYSEENVKKELNKYGFYILEDTIEYLDEKGFKQVLPNNDSVNSLLKKNILYYLNAHYYKTTTITLDFIIKDFKVINEYGNKIIITKQKLIKFFENEKFLKKSIKVHNSEVKNIPIYLEKLLKLKYIKKCLVNKKLRDQKDLSFLGI